MAEEKGVSQDLRESYLCAARAGDLDALEQLLALAGAEVRDALRINPKWRSVLDVDDVMQVTYMEVFVRFDQFVGNRIDAFRRWISQIAQNNLRDAIRALECQKRPQPDKRVRIAAGHEDSYVSLCEMLGATSTTPSRAVAASEARSSIENALQQMPENYADSLRLFDLEGCTGPEVADRLGCSRVTAYLLRARARDRLRDLLGSASRFLSDPA
jgi:RNA polymerase sigma factor (sigma-70 family)